MKCYAKVPNRVKSMSSLTVLCHCYEREKEDEETFIGSSGQEEGHYDIDVDSTGPNIRDFKADVSLVLSTKGFVYEIDYRVFAYRADLSGVTIQKGDNIVFSWTHNYNTHEVDYDKRGREAHDIAVKTADLILRSIDSVIKAKEQKVDDSLEEAVSVLS